MITMACFPTHGLPWLLFLLTFTTSTQFATISHGYPTSAYGVHGSATTSRVVSSRGRDLMANSMKTFFYNQMLDHFSYKPESYRRFQQRYVISDEHWGGATENAPIFVFLGAEEAIDDDLLAVGFLNENAPLFQALVVFIEHRYYGMSNPVGSMKKSIEDPEIRGYFNSAQALADYAEIIQFLKEKLKAKHSPVIVFGGSYGGMLAAWLRLKYPHLALGALASSAPVLMNAESTDTYFSWVTKDFRDTSENCYRTIKRSWREIDKLGSQPNGLSILSEKLNTCSELNGIDILKTYLKFTYGRVAQYNAPPEYPLSKICNAVDEASNSKGTHLLDRVLAGITSITDTGLVGMATNNKGKCLDVYSGEYLTSLPNDTALGLPWQFCSELVNPFGVSSSSSSSMFLLDPFKVDDFIKQCTLQYGVPPRPFWFGTYYGNEDLKLVLKRFGSNIIFSNGLLDPYSQMGVLESLSDTLIAVKAAEGCHTLDLLPSSSTDPGWLTAMRKKEVEIITTWISTYNADLREFLDG